MDVQARMMSLLCVIDGCSPQTGTAAYDWPWQRRSGFRIGTELLLMFLEEFQPPSPHRSHTSADGGDQDRLLVARRDACILHWIALPTGLERFVHMRVKPFHTPDQVECSAESVQFQKNLIVDLHAHRQ